VRRERGWRWGGIFPPYSLLLRTRKCVEWTIGRIDVLLLSPGARGREKKIGIGGAVLWVSGQSIEIAHRRIGSSPIAASGELIPS
jgi:hypothetical protein